MGLRIARRLSARVLVVDDSAVNQRVAALPLQKLGCRVDVAGDGREAVDMVSRFPYDVVFMDCQMPEMDGYDATAEIRRGERAGEHLPIIAMTAHALAGERERCLAAGMDDYLTKPLRTRDLEKAVRAWSGTPPAEREEKVGEPSAGTAGAPAAGVMLLTAHEGSEQYRQGMEAGADDFLTKPFDPEQFQARLRVAERIWDLESEVASLSARLKASGPPPWWAGGVLPLGGPPPSIASAAREASGRCSRGMAARSTPSPFPSHCAGSR